MADSFGPARVETKAIASAVDPVGAVCCSEKAMTGIVKSQVAPAAMKTTLSSTSLMTAEF